MGTKGSIFSPSDYGSEQQLINVSVAEKAAPEEASKKKSGRGEHANPDELHKAEWVRAIKANDPSIAWSNFAYAGTLTEAMLLGNVSTRLGKPIEYDADKGCVTNVPEAAQYIRPEFRPGWGL